MAAVTSASQTLTLSSGQSNQIRKGNKKSPKWVEKKATVLFLAAVIL